MGKVSRWICRVVQHLVAGDRIEEALAKRQGPQVRLSETDPPALSEALVCDIDAVADIDPEDKAVRASHQHIRIDTSSGAGLENELTWPQESLQILFASLESEPLQVPRFPVSLRLSIPGVFRYSRPLHRKCLRRAPHPLVIDLLHIDKARNSFHNRILNDGGSIAHQGAFHDPAAFHPPRFEAQARPPLRTREKLGHLWIHRIKVLPLARIEGTTSPTPSKPTVVGSCLVDPTGGLPSSHRHWRAQRALGSETSRTAEALRHTA